MGDFMKMGEIMKKNILFLLTLFSLSSCGVFADNYYFYDDANSYHVLEDVGEGYLGVNEINIDWISGNIDIYTSDLYKYITVFEKSDDKLDDKYKCHLYQKGDELNIKYCKAGATFLKSTTKKLSVYIPTSLLLNDVEINSVSAAVSIDGLNASELDIDNVSGSINAKNINANAISYQGVSGSLFLSISNLATDVSIEQVSGSSVVSLKEDHPGFAVDFESVSGTFSSTFTTEKQGEKYLYKQPSLQIEFESVSGTLVLAIDSK